MKIFIILFCIGISFSWASVFDFKYLNDAKKAYENKDYEKAADSYSKVDNDESKFNEADSLYKAKKYDEALSAYSSITDKNLEFDKLYNMGNSYANLKNVDKAIDSYEKALKIKEDEDAKYNLELLKKKEEDNKKKNDKNKEDNKNNQQQKNKQKNEQKSNQDNDNDKNKQDLNKENKSKQEKQQNSQKQQKETKPEDLEEDDNSDKDANQSLPIEKQDISNMEERKWQKLLNQREINTLLLPLTKGDNNEKQPW